ncbi:hypothetical protein CEXT_612521 [Caerostris extrusa]|uniref:Uncharacterized protein n=1 Tax=Caerostris extrusa TaxID=172846 RepID=A0AAV4XMB5_CAEEX|nr:hypothetical protein CEXT_612521 [Caerostris extrusa]
MRVDDTPDDIFQYMDQIADIIDRCIENRCDQFRLVQQSAFKHASVDPKNLTIYGYIAREPLITELLERLRISRMGSDILWALYKKLEEEAQKYQHPTLLDRLDMDMKLKVESFSDSVNREVLDVYSLKLTLQHNIDAFMYYNNIYDEQYMMIFNVNYFKPTTIFMLEKYLPLSIQIINKNF